MSQTISSTARLVTKTRLKTKIERDYVVHIRGAEDAARLLEDKGPGAYVLHLDRGALNAYQRSNLFVTFKYKTLLVRVKLLPGEYFPVRPTKKGTTLCPVSRETFVWAHQLATEFLPLVKDIIEEVVSCDSFSEKELTYGPDLKKELFFKTHLICPSLENFSEIKIIKKKEFGVDTAIVSFDFEGFSVWGQDNKEGSEPQRLATFNAFLASFLDEGPLSPKVARLEKLPVTSPGRGGSRKKTPRKRARQPDDKKDIERVLKALEKAVYHRPEDDIETSVHGDKEWEKVYEILKDIQGRVRVCITFQDKHFWVHKGLFKKMLIILCDASDSVRTRQEIQDCIRHILQHMLTHNSESSAAFLEDFLARLEFETADVTEGMLASVYPLFELLPNLMDIQSFRNMFVSQNASTAIVKAYTLFASSSRLTRLDPAPEHKLSFSDSIGYPPSDNLPKRLCAMRPEAQMLSDTLSGAFDPIAEASSKTGEASRKYEPTVSPRTMSAPKGTPKLTSLNLSAVKRIDMAESQGIIRNINRSTRFSRRRKIQAKARAEKERRKASPNGSTPPKIPPVKLKLPSPISLGSGEDDCNSDDEESGKPSAAAELFALAETLGQLIVTAQLNGLLARYKKKNTLEKNRVSPKRREVHMNTRFRDTSFYKIKRGIMSLFAKLGEHPAVYLGVDIPADLFVKEFELTHSCVELCRDTAFRRLLFRSVHPNAELLEFFPAQRKTDNFLYLVHMKLNAALINPNVSVVNTIRWLDVLSHYIQECPTKQQLVQMVTICCNTLFHVQNLVFRKENLGSGRGVELVLVVHHILGIFDGLIEQTRDPKMHLAFATLLNEKQIVVFLRYYAQLLFDLEISAKVIHLGEDLAISGCDGESLLRKCRVRVFRHFQAMIKLISKQIRRVSHVMKQHERVRIERIKKRENKGTAASNRRVLACKQELRRYSEMLMNLDFLVAPHVGVASLAFAHLESHPDDISLWKEALRLLSSVFGCENNKFVQRKVYIDYYVPRLYMEFIKTFNAKQADRDNLELCTLYLNVLTAFSEFKDVNIRKKFYQLCIMEFLVREIDLEYEIILKKAQYLERMSQVKDRSSESGGAESADSITPRVEHPRSGRARSGTDSPSRLASSYEELSTHVEHQRLSLTMNLGIVEKVLGGEPLKSPSSRTLRNSKKKRLSLLLSKSNVDKAHDPLGSPAPAPVEITAGSTIRRSPKGMSSTLPATVSAEAPSNPAHRGAWRERVDKVAKVVTPRKDHSPRLSARTPGGSSIGPLKSPKSQLSASHSARRPEGADKIPSKSVIIHETSSPSGLQMSPAEIAQYKEKAKQLYQQKLQERDEELSKQRGETEVSPHLEITNEGGKGGMLEATRGMSFNQGSHRSKGIIPKLDPDASETAASPRAKESSSDCSDDSESSSPRAVRTVKKVWIPGLRLTAADTRDGSTSLGIGTVVAVHSPKIHPPEESSEGSEESSEESSDESSSEDSEPAASTKKMVIPGLRLTSADTRDGSASVGKGTVVTVHSPKEIEKKTAPPTEETSTESETSSDSEYSEDSSDSPAAPVTGKKMVIPGLRLTGGETRDGSSSIGQGTVVNVHSPKTLKPPPLSHTGEKDDSDDSTSDDSTSDDVSSSESSDAPVPVLKKMMIPGLRLSAAHTRDGQASIGKGTLVDVRSPLSLHSSNEKPLSSSESSHVTKSGSSSEDSSDEEEASRGSSSESSEDDEDSEHDEVKPPAVKKPLCIPGLRLTGDMTKDGVIRQGAGLNLREGDESGLNETETSVGGIVLPKLDLVGRERKATDVHEREQERLSAVVTEEAEEEDGEASGVEFFGQLTALEHSIVHNDPNRHVGFRGPKASSDSKPMSMEEVTKKNMLYYVHRKERKIYLDGDLHISLLKLILSLLTTEVGVLDSEYTDQYPLNKGKMNILYLLHVHLSHPSNGGVVPGLVKACHKMHHSVFRLLKLLSNRLLKPNMFTNMKRMAIGAYGTVFSAEIRGDQLPVAIKLMELPKNISDRCVLHDIFTEVFLLDKLAEDERVCRMYDYGVDNDNYWVVMKKYKTSLKSWRQKQTRPIQENLPLYINIFRKVLETMKVTYENDAGFRFNHFDIKCDNFLLHPLQPDLSDDDFYDQPDEVPNFSVVLADFGESLVFHGDDEGYTIRNVGTEFNKPPEMLNAAYANRKHTAAHDRRLAEGANAGSDIWALGCLFYELITGEFLFYDQDWVRFFIRVTTPKQELFSNERLELIDYDERLISFFKRVLIREPKYRPTLPNLIRLVDNLAKVVSDGKKTIKTPRWQLRKTKPSRDLWKSDAAVDHVSRQDSEPLVAEVTANRSMQRLMRTASVMTFKQKGGKTQVNTEQSYFRSFPTKVSKGLYIGTEFAAQNKVLLKKTLGITHILACTADRYQQFEDFSYMTVAHDRWKYSWFVKELFAFILDAHASNGRVFIFDHMSTEAHAVALAIKYLMHTGQAVSYFEGFAMIQNLRYVIEPDIATFNKLGSISIRREADAPTGASVFMPPFLGGAPTASSQGGSKRVKKKELKKKESSGEKKKSRVKSGGKQAAPLVDPTLSTSAESMKSLLPAASSFTPRHGQAIPAPGALNKPPESRSVDDIRFGVSPPQLGAPLVEDRVANPLMAMKEAKLDGFLMLRARQQAIFHSSNQQWSEVITKGSAGSKRAHAPPTRDSRPIPRGSKRGGTSLKRKKGTMDESVTIFEMGFRNSVPPDETHRRRLSLGGGTGLPDPSIISSVPTPLTDRGEARSSADILIDIGNSRGFGDADSDILSSSASSGRLSPRQLFQPIQKEGEELRTLSFSPRTESDDSSGRASGSTSPATRRFADVSQAPQYLARSGSGRSRSNTSDAIPILRKRVPVAASHDSLRLLRTSGGENPTPAAFTGRSSAGSSGSSNSLSITSSEQGSSVASSPHGGLLYTESPASTPAKIEKKKKSRRVSRKKERKESKTLPKSSTLSPSLWNHNQRRRSRASVLPESNSTKSPSVKGRSKRSLKADSVKSPVKSLSLADKGGNLGIIGQSDEELLLSPESVTVEGEPASRSGLRASSRHSKGKSRRHHRRRKEGERSGDRPTRLELPSPNTSISSVSSAASSRDSSSLTPAGERGADRSLRDSEKEEAETGSLSPLAVNAVLAEQARKKKEKKALLRAGCEIRGTDDVLPVLPVEAQQDVESSTESRQQRSQSHPPLNPSPKGTEKKRLPSPKATSPRKSSRDAEGAFFSALARGASELQLPLDEAASSSPLPAAPSSVRSRQERDKAEDEFFARMGGGAADMMKKEQKKAHGSKKGLVRTSSLRLSIRSVSDSYPRRLNSSRQSPVSQRIPLRKRKKDKKRHSDRDNSRDSGVGDSS